MKYTRLILGSALVVAGLWVVVGEQMSGASADAVINARVTTLRSDVAGKLDLKDRAVGTRVDAGETMFSVQNPLSDSVHLNDLLMEQGLARAKLSRIEAELASSKEQRASLLERADG